MSHRISRAFSVRSVASSSICCYGGCMRVHVRSARALSDLADSIGSLIPGTQENEGLTNFLRYLPVCPCVPANPISLQMLQLHQQRQMLASASRPCCLSPMARSTREVDRELQFLRYAACHVSSFHALPLWCAFQAHLQH